MKQLLDLILIGSSICFILAVIECLINLVGKLISYYKSRQRLKQEAIEYIQKNLIFSYKNEFKKYRTKELLKIVSCINRTL